MNYLVKTFCIFLFFTSFKSAQADNLELISKDQDSNAAGQCIICNQDFLRIDMSDDGRFIVFSSISNNIVEGDTNNSSVDSDIYGPSADVFLYDRLLDRVERVSLRADGGQIETGFSWEPSISADGKFIAYSSTANDIFPNDNNQPIGSGYVVEDVILFDVENHRTTWVSVSPESEGGNGASYFAQISKDGNYIIYLSLSSNLIQGWEPSGIVWDVFLHNIVTGLTQLVSIGIDGNQTAKPRIGGIPEGGPVISGDGRYAAFISGATNVTSEGVGGVFVRDMESGITELISRLPDGSPATSGGFSNLSITREGRNVSFYSSNEQLVQNDHHTGWDSFIYDRHTGVMSIISPIIIINNEERRLAAVTPTISATGRYVVFISGTELYWYDRQTEEARLLLSIAGYVGGVFSFRYSGEGPATFRSNMQITPDGSKVLFTTDARGLVPEDTNLFYDVYLLDLDDAPSAVPGWELN